MQETGTSKHELQLTGKLRVEQAVENLHPNAKYQLSGWLKVTDERSPVILGVSGCGGPDATVSCADKGWERKTVDFTTGAGVTRITVFIERTSATGQAFADNLGLPRNPPGPWRDYANCNYKINDMAAFHHNRHHDRNRH